MGFQYFFFVPKIYILFSGLVVCPVHSYKIVTHTSYLFFQNINFFFVSKFSFNYHINPFTTILYSLLFIAIVMKAIMKVSDLWTRMRKITTHKKKSHN